ncbi:hypothetical protein [Cupriavidus necator]
MPREISKFDDIIDSRDVIKRIEEIDEYEDALTTARQAYDDALDTRSAAIAALDELRIELDNAEKEHGYGSPQADAAEEQFRLAGEKQLEAEDSLGDAERDLREAESEFTEDLQEELKVLRALADQGEGYGDWSHGETLIHEDYFTKYAEQLADDIGAIDRNARWPLSHIDWEAAANELKTDYTSIEFDGETFWMRS